MGEHRQADGQQDQPHDQPHDQPQASPQDQPVDQSQASPQDLAQDPRQVAQEGEQQAAFPPAQGPGGARRNPLAAVNRLLTPLIVGGASVVLLVLTVLTYALRWKKATQDGSTMIVDGFGIQKMSAEGDNMHSMATVFYLLGMVVILLLLAPAVLALTTAYQKIAALCLVVAGGVGVIYTVISLFSDLGMDTSFMGMEAGDSGDPIDWGLSYGIFLALVVSLVTLALGVLYFLAAQGPLVPRTAAATPATGLTALFRPLYVVGASAVLFVLLLVSYLLDWRSYDEEGGGMTVNGFGSRGVTFSVYGESSTYSDVSVTMMVLVTLVFVLIAGGALVAGLTVWKWIGGLLTAVGAAAGLFIAFIGLITDYGMFGDMGAESLGDYDADSSASIGVFLALLVSLVLLVVSVLFVLVQFGVLGGARFRTGSGQYGFGQPGQPGSLYGQYGQYGQAPQSQSNEYGQQIPPAPGRW